MMGAAVSGSGPFQWMQANVDLMVFCLVISFVAAGITIFLKTARGSSVVVALLSSFLFTSLGVPYMAIQHSLPWTHLSLLSAVIGFGALTLPLGAIRIAETLQKKGEDAAVKWGGSKLGNEPQPPKET